MLEILVVTTLILIALTLAVNLGVNLGIVYLIKNELITMRGDTGKTGTPGAKGDRGKSGKCKCEEIKYKKF